MAAGGVRGETTLVPAVRRTDGARKRGRPQTISEEKKAAAARIKAEGGSNHQAAALIYGTKHSSVQQRKNVVSILRHYHRKSVSAPASVGPYKPQKTKG